MERAPKQVHAYNTKCIATPIDNKHLIEQLIRNFVKKQQDIGIKSSIKCDASFVKQQDNIYLMRRKKIGIFAKSTLDSVQCFTLNTNNNKFHILPCRLNNNKTIWVQEELFPNAIAKNQSVLGFVLNTSNVIVIHLLEKTIGVLENKIKIKDLVDYQPGVDANPHKDTDEIPLINPADILNPGCDDEHVNFLMGEVLRFHQRGLTTISIPELIETVLYRMNSASIDDQQLACARIPIQYESSDDGMMMEDDEECMMMNNDDSSHAIYNLERSLIPSHNNDSSAAETSKTSLQDDFDFNFDGDNKEDDLPFNFDEGENKDDLPFIFNDRMQAYSF